MMSRTNLCRLCLDTRSRGLKTLYDENGRGNELYDITTNYFHPMILNMSVAQHLRGICLECWRHIWGFHNFQKVVAEAQSKLIVEVEDDVVVKLEDFSTECEEGSTSLDNVKTEDLSNEYQEGSTGLDNVNVDVFSVKVKDEFGRLTESETVIAANVGNLCSVDAVKSESSETPEDSYENDGDEVVNDAVELLQQFNKPRESQRPTAGAATEHDLISLPKLELVYMLDDSGSCSDENESMALSDACQDDSNCETEKGYPRILVTVGKELNKTCGPKSIPIALPKLEITDVHAAGEPSSEEDDADEDGEYLAQRVVKVEESPQIKEEHDSILGDDTSQMEEDSLPEYDSEDDNNVSADQYKPKRQKFDNLDDLLANWIPNIVCVVCSKSWPTFSSLRQHFRQTHPLQEFYIECCNCKFSTKNKIEEHLLVHKDPNAFTCKLCGRCHTTKCGLTRHISMLHPETLDRKYVCNKCDKVFPTERGLKCHDNAAHNTFKRRPTVVVQEDGSTVYICNECGYTCHTTRAYSQHRWYYHKVEATHKCTVCGKLFNRPSLLRQHKFSHRENNA